MRPIALIIGGLILAFGLPPMPTIPALDWPAWNVVTPVATVDRVTLVYEKDGDPVLPAVRAGINGLNNRGIVADLYEVNDDEEIKPAYVAAVEAAKKSGLPSLVVMAGGKVLRVVKSPATEAAVLEAVP